MTPLVAPTSRLRAYLWACVAGLLLGHAYLAHGALAWLAGLSLGLAVEALPAHGWRRGMVAVGALAQLWVGLLAWGFTYQSWPVFLAQLLYSAAAGALFGWLAGAWGGRAPASTLGLVLAWTAVETLRELGPVGFPLSLGATQAHLPLRSALGLVGGAVLGGLIVGFGHVVARAPVGRLTAAPLAWLAGLAAIVAFGGWQPGLEPDGAARRVAVVQGSIPSWLYSVSNSSAVGAALVTGRYHALSAEALESAPDLVLMPESALHRRVAIIDGEASEALFGRTGASGDQSWVITGASRETLVEDAGGARLVTFNSALLLRGDDPYRVWGAIDKQLTVPLAEAHLTPGGAARAGSGTSGVLTLGAWRIGVLICFESLYERLARVMAPEMGVLAVITNDAGFRRSGIAFAHAVQGWARAVETGRPLVRAAQSGISLAVDGFGERLGLLPSEVAGVLSVTVQPTRGWTWFSRFGYVLGPAALALAVVGATPLAPWRRGRSSSASPSMTAQAMPKVA